VHRTVLYSPVTSTTCSSSPALAATQRLCAVLSYASQATSRHGAAGLQPLLCLLV
jgi:hypothetical protein